MSDLVVKPPALTKAEIAALSIDKLYALAHDRRWVARKLRRVRDALDTAIDAWVNSAIDLEVAAEARVRARHPSEGSTPVQ